MCIFNKQNLFSFLLVVEFWISGLFVLSVIFLNIPELEDLTLVTFIGYSVGSFLAGIFSDIIGRKPLFIVCSIGLFISSILLFWNLTAGFILANFCIGPLNNLTFVFINENYETQSQIKTVYVLVGWALSQITLGVFFLFIQNNDIFFLSLFVITLIYTLGAILLTQQTQQFELKRAELQERTIREILLPVELKSIIAGSIVMFMMQMFYYRTQFTLDKFGVSLPINTIIVGCTEVLANISFYRIMRSCKRRSLLQILIFCLMILMLGLILTKIPTVQTIVQGFMRLFDTSIMLLLGVYLPELFPISERGKGTNYIMCFGVFGSALSGKIFTKLPFAYLEIFLFSAIIASIFLPQTKIDKNEQQELLTSNLEAST